MRRSLRPLIAWLALSLVAALGPPVAAQPVAESVTAFDALVDDFAATGKAWENLGRPGAAERLRERLGALRVRLDEIDATALDDERWIDAEILAGRLDHQLADLAFRLGDPVEGLPDPEAMAKILEGSSVDRTVDLYARLRRLPGAMLDRRAGLRPADTAAVDRAVERIDHLRRLLAEKGPAAEERLSEFGDVPREVRLGADLALDVHRRVLDGPVRERAPPPGPGVGRARFEARLIHEHRIDQPLEEILADARRVRAETIAELERTAARIDPERTWQEISEAMKGEGPPADELLDFAKATMAESLEFLRREAFVPLPDWATNCGVRGESPRRRYPYAYYQPARGKDLRGEYVVTTVGDWMTAEQARQKTRDSNRYWMRVVTVHEAFPGHHLQFAIAARARTKIRGGYYTPFFSEGWGLYVEELMWRHGFYDDKTRLAQLRMRLWRVARVEADIGIHTRTMTPEEAVDLLVETSLLEPDSARKEVDRYLGSPTQPMSYLVGFLAIERLREAYHRRHPDDEDWELEFHTRLLAHGSVPLSVLEPIVLGERPPR